MEKRSKACENRKASAEVFRRERKRRTGIDKSIKIEKWIFLEGYWKGR